MQFRILITKTLDVPLNLHQALFATEEDAVKAAKDRLLSLDGDVAIVMKLFGGEAKVLHRFEKVGAGA